MRTVKLLIPLLLVVALALCCQRRPLFYMEEEGMKVIVKVLWKAEVYPEGIKPSGVSLYLFRDGEFYMAHTTSNVDSSALQLEPGTYRLFMITQSPEEYGRMEFDHMTDFNNASVSVTETQSKWYSRAADEELISNPEMMSVGVSEVFEVSEETVENYQHYTHNLNQYRRAAGTKADGDIEDPTLADDINQAQTMINYYTIRVPIYPKSIVSQYWVTIYSDNVDVLMSVRASTSGMAKTFELTQDVTGEDIGTQFITQWAMTIDEPATRIGHVDGKITTFGFPNGEVPSAMRDSTLNVSALLIDNQTVENYVFNVGDKITSEDPPEGYRALYRLIFGSTSAPAIHPPDVRPPDSGGGGFTAGVTEWDEEMHVGVDI